MSTSLHQSDIRDMLSLYVASEIEILAKNSAFRELLEETSDLLGDFLAMAAKRLR